MNLSWTAAPSGTVRGYVLQRDGVPLPEQTGITFADKNLVASTTYTYRLQTVDPAGTLSGPSAPVTTTTPECGPPNPHLSGYLSGVGTVRSVRVVGTKAYVATDPFGLSIFDVSNPATPVLLGSANQPFFGDQVAVAGNRAIVLGNRAGKVHFYVLDVANAAAPRVLGELSTTTAFPAASFTVDLTMNAAGTIALAAIGAPGVLAIDISTPSAPRVASTFDTAGAAQGVELNPAGTLVYVADGGGGLRILTLSPSGALSATGALASGRQYRDVEVQGNYAYAVHQSAALDVVDVSTPSAPRIVKTVLLSGWSFQVALSGNRALVFITQSPNDLVDVVDITAPTNATKTGSTNLGAAGMHRGIDFVGANAFAAGTQGFKTYSVAASGLTLLKASTDEFVPFGVAQAGSVAVVVGQYVPTSLPRIQVVDVANAAAPRVIGRLVLDVPSWFGMTPYIALNATGTRAVVTLGTHGVRTIDLTTPAAPRVIGTYDTPGISGAVALNPTTTIAYVADGSGGLQVLNVADSGALTPAGTLGGRTYRGLGLQGSYVYAAQQSAGFDVIDVANPAAPRVVGFAPLSNWSFDVAVSGNRAIVETNIGTNNSTSAIDVVDISNPAAPAKIATIPVGPSFDLRLALKGTRAFVAFGTTGLRILDLANPTAPPIDGDTLGSAKDVAVVGNTAYVADSPATLDVISL